MEGSIKDLQESTNHLVEWFPICVDVFFFGLFLYKVDEQKVFTSLRVVVEWDEYQNVFCMQHAGLKICRPVKIELCGTKQVGERRRKKQCQSRWACRHESWRPTWIYLDAQKLKLCRLVPLSSVCIDVCLSLGRWST